MSLEQVNPTTENIEEVENTEEVKPEIKSTILSDEEVEKVLNEDEEVNEEDVKLPSEEKEEEEIDPKEELERLKQELEELKKQKQEPKKEDNQLLSEMAQKALTEGLNEEDYKRLEQLGYDKETVDVFVEGLKAKQEKSAEQLLEGITTIDEYKEAIDYAAEHWDEQQIEEYNKVLADGNPAAVRIAVRALIKEYKGGRNAEVDTLHRNTERARPEGIKSYETKADMMKDMQDPRYGKDIAYTRKVEQRIKMTDMSKWYQ